MFLRLLIFTTSLIASSTGAWAEEIEGSTSEELDSPQHTSEIWLSVEPEQWIPVVSSQWTFIQEDQPANFQLHSISADGDAITWHVKDPQHGKIHKREQGFSYVPSENFHGKDLVQLTSVSSDGRVRHFYVPITVNAVNDAPIADAGRDLVVEQNSPQGTHVQLNGSKSTDTDGEMLTYTWISRHGRWIGVNPTLLLPAGSHRIQLRVQDPQGATAEAMVNVRVQDTTAPRLTCAIRKKVFSPFETELTNVQLHLRAEDNGDSKPTVSVAVYSDEPDLSSAAGSESESDMKLSAPFTLKLRGRCSETGSGRVYLVVIKAQDKSGNSTVYHQTVVVPKSESKEDLKTVLEKAAMVRKSFKGSSSKHAPYRLGNTAPRQKIVKP